MVLIRLRVCTDWSAPLLFASNKVRVSRVKALIMLKPRLPGLRLATRLTCCFYYLLARCSDTKGNYKKEVVKKNRGMKNRGLKNWAMKKRAKNNVQNVNQKGPEMKMKVDA